MANKWLEISLDTSDQEEISEKLNEWLAASEMDLKSRALRHQNKKYLEDDSEKELPKPPSTKLFGIQMKIFIH